MRGADRDDALHRQPAEDAGAHGGPDRLGGLREDVVRQPVVPDRPVVGDIEGPVPSGAPRDETGWAVNADAHRTAVVANKGKVAATFGYRSINETDVRKVKEALAKAIKGT